MVILYILIFLVFVSSIVRAVELDIENRDLKKKLEFYESNNYAQTDTVYDEGHIYQVEGSFDDYKKK